jgi:N-acetylglucosaminyldiphosphoundecaprenol N-acetyl-beta-D-mannosaminyltransferase
LGVGFDPVKRSEAAFTAMQLLERPGFHYAVTPNPEIVQLARKRADYARILAQADLVLPDGIGIVYAAKILGKPLRERVPGIDFAAELLERLAAAEKRLYLLGAKPGVAEEAGRVLQTRYPGLVLCGLADGYFAHGAAAAAAVARAEADVVFVCLGAPKQETWIAEYGAGTGAKLLVGLGGCLDVWAGRVPRAPPGWRRLGLEWLYRLLREPKRAGRMAKLPLFLLTALRLRVTGKSK